MIKLILDIIWLFYRVPINIWEQKGAARITGDHPHNPFPSAQRLWHRRGAVRQAPQRLRPAIQRDWSRLLVRPVFHLLLWSEEVQREFVEFWWNQMWLVYQQHQSVQQGHQCEGDPEESGGGSCGGSGDWAGSCVLHWPRSQGPGSSHVTHAVPLLWQVRTY